MKFKNLFLKIRLVILDFKWEQGMCVRTYVYKGVFCIFFRSSIEVFKFRVGNTGKNSLGKK